MNIESMNKKTAKSVLADLCTACLAILIVAGAGGPSALSAPASKAPGKSEGKAAEKAADKIEPDPVVENVQNVSPEQLIDKPHDFLNKNVKFTANFASFSSLALDYKPAMRASKQYLSFLVSKENSKIPLAEIKLAMLMPKEKDEVRNKLLTQLKEGDQVEITGKVFSTALDEPWLDVLKLKKLKSAPEEKDKKLAAEEKDNKDKKAADTEPEVKNLKPSK